MCVAAQIAEVPSEYTGTRFSQTHLFKMHGKPGIEMEIGRLRADPDWVIVKSMQHDEMVRDATFYLQNEKSDLAVHVADWIIEHKLGKTSPRNRAPAPR